MSTEHERFTERYSNYSDKFREHAWIGWREGRELLREELAAAALTNEQIDAVWADTKAPDGITGTQWRRKITRAIEAAIRALQPERGEGS